MSESGRAELLQRLRGLARELRADAASAMELEAVRRREPELQELQEDLERQIGRVRQAAVITLVGATGAGKSTLLNALVGSDVAVSGEDRPTTRAPVVYAPQDAELDEVLHGLPGERPRVVRYDATSGGPWTEQVFVDAPDINSVASAHREVVRALAERSDVLVVVLHRQSVAEEASVRFVDAFAGRRHVICVLNRADELTDESRAKLHEAARRLAEERWQCPAENVLATSGLAARTRPDTPGWSELTRKLAELVRGGVLGAVRRHNALGTARRAARVGADLRAEVEGDLTNLPERVGEGVGALAAWVSDEVGLRLRLRRPDFTDLFCSEVAKRWDGPAGWALRTGSLGSLGLGAGALLARRNPLLAAGAAVGGLAAGKVRDASRRRQLSGPEALLPPPGDFRRRHGEVLAEARLAAARLTGEADGLAVPGPEAAHERVLGAVLDPWERALGRDLLARAGRAAPAPLRLLLDLPVYALAGWVVYRAGGGFLQEQYVGLDFLVNALLLLLAYLFVVRFVVRRGFDLVARRLLGEVVESVEEALGVAAEEAREESRQACARVARSLERLEGIEARFRAEVERPAPEARALDTDGA